MPRVMLINESLSLFLQADTKHEINIINIGVNALFRNSAKGLSAGVECIFRLSLDGAFWLIPFMTKRIIYSDSIESMKFLLSKKYSEIHDLPEEKL